MKAVKKNREKECAFNRSFNEHHTFMSRAMERKQSRGWLDNLPKYTEWENENNKK